MTDEGIGPKSVTVEDVQYDYKRVFVEHLHCQTCSGVFITHIPSGNGAFFIGDDKTEADICPGCKEILRNQEITEEDRVKPS